MMMVMMKTTFAAENFIRRLSWSISSEFGAIRSWNVCRSPKSHENLTKLLFWRSVSSKVIVFGVNRYFFRRDDTIHISMSKVIYRYFRSSHHYCISWLGCCTRFDSPTVLLLLLLLPAACTSMSMMTQHVLSLTAAPACFRVRIGLLTPVLGTAKASLPCNNYLPTDYER